MLLWGELVSRIRIARCGRLLRLEVPIAGRPVEPEELAGLSARHGLDEVVDGVLLEILSLMPRELPKSRSESFCASMMGVVRSSSALVYANFSLRAL